MNENIKENRVEINALIEDGYKVWLDFFEKNGDVIITGMKCGNSQYWTVPDGNVNDYADIINHKGGYIAFNGMAQSSWKKFYPGDGADPFTSF